MSNLSDIRGRRWISAFLAVVLIPMLAVNIFLVRMALTSNTGLVSDNAFDTGQSYNQVISAGQRQAALGWQGRLDMQPITPAGEHKVRLVLRFADASGAPLSALSVNGRLFSPVDPAPDQPVALTEVAPGLYQQELTLPRGGQWDVQLLARRDSEQFAIDQRVILGSGGSP